MSTSTPPGDRSLPRLLAHLAPRLSPTPFVFLHFPGTARPPPYLPVQLQVQEAEGVTLVTPRSDADANALPGVEHAYPCRLITLEVASSLEAIGLLAAVTESLARAGLSVNAASGFVHDHLFAKEGEASRAMEVLEGLAKNARAGLEKGAAES